MIERQVIPESNEKFSFTSTLLAVFTVFVAIFVLYHLAASTSALAEGIAFLFGLAAFLGLSYVAAKQLLRSK